MSKLLTGTVEADVVFGESNWECFPKQPENKNDNYIVEITTGKTTLVLILKVFSLVEESSKVVG